MSSDPRGTPKLFLALFAAALAACCSAPALAQRPQALRDGIRAYTQVEYQPALMYLKTALRRVRQRKDLTLTYFYLGCTYLALDRKRSAQEMFETLLSFEPSYVPDPRLTSPKIARFFAQVRESYDTPLAPPTISHRELKHADPRLTLLYLSVRNLSIRLRPVLRYRTGASPSFFSVEARKVFEGRATFALPTPPDGSDIFYYFALMDRGGVIVLRLGKGEKPFRLTVLAQGEDPPSAGATPWYKTWWFWTAVGAVAVGTGVGLGVGLAGDDSSTAKITILRRDASGNSVPIFAP